MASQLSQQYAFLTRKSMGLIGGTPTYMPIEGFTVPDIPIRTYHYSPDGRLVAYVLPTVVWIFLDEGTQLLQELSVPNIIKLKFSLRGTYLSTWERPGTPHVCHPGCHTKISASTGEELISFTQKSRENWDLLYTMSESHAIRLVAQEIQVYRPSEWGKGIANKLHVKGTSMISLSPGLNPSVALFVAEKKAAPAIVKICGPSTLSGVSTCSKTFYKAGCTQIKWNDLGTQVLVFTQTEVDNLNMSYYGETGMYLLSAAGDFNCRITLGKEGPIHDVSWSPNSKEFGVVYGYMPAKTTLFDQRVRTLHDFGSSPCNFIAFNLQGHLHALAGFGYLAGKIDIFDRRMLMNICAIDAPNTSYCKWSPCGRFLLTATLSPRLRVDNGIKVWHCTGGLMHVQPVEELYQASWRPTLLDQALPFGLTTPAAPQPSISVLIAALTAKPATPKAAGAYRSPGARGLAMPAIFKRENEGGASRMPTSSGSATPPWGYNRSPNPSGSMGHANGATPSNGNGHYQNGNGGRRHVPGAAPKTPSNAPALGTEGGEKKLKKKGKKKEKGPGEAGLGTATPTGGGVCATFLLM
ncbi:eukaryotic translation initiation factor eIF2A-domain-containing protein [Suillus subluteus]|nr:eukaryotic translation initiation factor eIF2A-domain-containing protein [Suillus subluteus]